MRALTHTFAILMALWMGFGIPNYASSSEKGPLANLSEREIFRNETTYMRVKFALVHYDRIMDHGGFDAYSALCNDLPEGQSPTGPGNAFCFDNGLLDVSNGSRRVLVTQHETGAQILVGVAVDLAVRGITEFIEWAWATWFEKTKDDQGERVIVCKCPGGVKELRIRVTGVEQVKKYNEEASRFCAA